MADAANTSSINGASVALGLRENWQQFALLVLINAFVEGMVGLERTLVPLIGSETFQLASTAAVTSFIVSFGVVKALTNLVSGQLADTWGRKRTLILGWAAGLPVPFLIMWAPAWGWIVAANVLLGVNQGLAWSMTVIMKVDLVGPRQRGLAVGLNEFAGYLAVGAAAPASPRRRQSRTQKSALRSLRSSHRTRRPRPAAPLSGRRSRSRGRARTGRH